MTLKRLAAPKFWKIQKKTKKYTITPVPGPFPTEKCIPLGIIIREMLGLAENIHEAKFILNSGTVRVNNTVRKDYRFPAGVMDVLSVGENNFILFPSAYGLSLFKTNTHSKKLLLVKNKTTLAKNRIQVNFHDGTNMVTDKPCKTHDVVVFDLIGKKIDDIVEFKKGSFAVIINGKNVGKTGKLSDINSGEKNVAMEINGNAISIPKDYVFVLGKEKPAIHVGERL